MLATMTICTANAQSDVRTVIKTPRNEHEIYRYKGPKDKVLLSYLDNEKVPFTGKFIEKAEEGELISERNYVKGLLNGEFIDWTGRETRYIKIKGTYKNNKLFGEYTEWWRPDDKKKECFYDENGELHGKMIIHDGLSVKEISEIQFYNHGAKDGTWTRFFSDGKINHTRNYKNGKENGENLEYYENGNKRYQENYVSGKRTGLLSEWYENGQLKYTCEYSNGKKNGKEIFFYPNGKIEKEGMFVNENKKGHFIWYKQDGTISEETTFQ